jgi:hypothetical protein
MFDYQIQTVIQSTLVAGLAARGISAGVKQNNQPRQFVAPSSPTVFHSISSRKPFGWPTYRDTFNQTSGAFDTTKTQVIHTRFQIAGCVTNASPGNPTGLTSGDLASAANSIMTDEANIAAFVAAGFNVFRVQELPLIWFQDSSAQNVAWAPFDIIFTHKDEYVTSTGVIGVFDPNIQRI